jgi:hypothetical protein
MSKFPDWFKRAYKRWTRSHPGGEDFLAFCAWVGYPPALILDWIQGDAIPNGHEALNLASILGKKVYTVLDIPQPDVEIFKVSEFFSELNGIYRARLARILWEAAQEMQEKGIPASSEQGMQIVIEAFRNGGFDMGKGSLSQ